MRSEGYPQIVSAWDDEPDCIRLMMPGQDFTLSHDMAWELNRQMLALLPVEYRPEYQRVGVLILSLFVVACALALFLGSVDSPGLFRVVAGFALIGVILQSILFTVSVWRHK